MYLGTAMSRLVDPPERRMNFDSEEMTSSQGRRYLSLTELQDQLGSIDDLGHKEANSELSNCPMKKPTAKENESKEAYRRKAPSESKVISIEEIGDESESEDEDLPVYAKPDSDASDSDEDPTVIERNKPTAPVYIDDLVSGLRDTDNYDRHLLALTHASPLIRRKAAFGTEVTDNCEDLANILTGLGDKWNVEQFQELRVQGMIAVLVAQPLEMGQWFSRTYFNGDYSIQQRATVLTTLGLGARELAGYGKEDMALTKSNPQPSSKDAASFPSKQLPPKLHALYTSEKPALPDIPGAKAVHTASRTLEQAILQPMALQAADALSGPNALKVRTFSSRIEVEKRRTKPIPNALAKVVAEGFFFPLTGRWGMHVQS
ncbi:telomere binding protein [Xanthoria calcicola]